MRVCLNRCLQPPGRSSETTFFFKAKQMMHLLHNVHTVQRNSLCVGQRIMRYYVYERVEPNYIGTYNLYPQQANR